MPGPSSSKSRRLYPRTRDCDRCGLFDWCRGVYPQNARGEFPPPVVWWCGHCRGQMAGKFKVARKPPKP